MPELENSLSALLQNPELMRQVMNLAQSFGTQSAPPSPPPQAQPAAPQQEEPPRKSAPDMATIARIAGLAGQAGIDSNQQTLLRALSPYLSREKVDRLARAMRAAKLADAASSALGPGGLEKLLGG